MDINWRYGFKLRMHTTHMNAQLVEFRQQIRTTAGDSDHKVDRQTRKLLMYMFTGTRGGFTRLRITMLLLDAPCNTHRLAQRLGLDYKAVQHHLRVMEKNNLVSRTGDRYGALYHISNLLEYNISALLEAIDRLERKLNSKKVYI